MTDHETFLLLAAKQIGEPLSAGEEADLDGHLASCPDVPLDRCGHAPGRHPDAGGAGRRDGLAAGPASRARRGGRTPAHRSAPRPRPRGGSGGGGDRRAPARRREGGGRPVAVGANAVGGRHGAVDTTAPTPSPLRRSLSRRLLPWRRGCRHRRRRPGRSCWGTTSTAPPRRGGTRLAAHFEDGGPVGEWSRRTPGDRRQQRLLRRPRDVPGDLGVGCLAGRAGHHGHRRETTVAVFIHVTDGGPDGEGDTAFMWQTR